MIKYEIVPVEPTEAMNCAAVDAFRATLLASK